MSLKVTFPEKVRLKDVDLKDDTFSISFPKDVDKLKVSIREIGLLTPLILRGKDNHSTFQIIAGYKRGIALRELGVDCIPAYIFKYDEFDNEKALRLSLLENLYTRELNHIEISNFLFKLKEKLNIHSEKIIEDYLPLLGLEESFLILKKYLSLQNLVEGLKRLAIVKKFHVKILSRLSLLSHKDQEVMLDLAAKLDLGFNLANELLTLLEEIAGRDNVSISDLISDKSFAEILNREGMSRDRKTNLLISLLKEKRYPHIQDFAKQVKNHIKNLNLPNKIAIDIPENLEGEAVTMRFKFKDKKDYQDILNSLMKISESEDLSKILEMI